MTGIGLVLTAFHKVRRTYWRLFEPTIVGVRALVVRDGQVMLVRHTYMPGWYLPGGKVERGETVLAAMCREVAEECALRVKRARLCAIYSNREQNRNDHIALYSVEDFEPCEAFALRPLEIAESGFFALHALPPDTTPATHRRLQEYEAQAFDGQFW